MPGAVVLVGPMGVGKTTIGKKLAKHLDRSFVDTDKEITKEHGPISKMFERFGEEHFRTLESSYLAKSLVPGAVVATGGGVVTKKENREMLKSEFVVYLSTNGRHIAARLLSGRRPLLKNGVDDWSRIYEERKHLYSEVAKYEVDTSSKSLTSIVHEIAELVDRHG